MTDYTAFIEEKIVLAKPHGFKINRNEINPVCFGFQKDTIQWAIEGGCRAIFAAFGLGKTITQLELARIVLSHYPGKALIVCPLGVKQEFSEDSKLLDIEISYVRTDIEVDACKTDIMITNYERVRDGNINPDKFVFASLDEASVLRGFGTKTYQSFLRLFQNVPYKYVCTATPSPNRYKELLHYAGFLGVMDTGQSLTRFFKRDSTKANKLTLYPHKEREFWLWVSSWALFITKPSDLGYPDDGYDLPPLEVVYHKLPVDHSTALPEKDGQGRLLRDAAYGLQDAAREKRESIPARIQKTVSIIESNPGRHWVIWHDLEAERKAIETAIPEVISVYGSQDIDVREQNIIDFAYGKLPILATKPTISGSGCNFQRFCADAVFVGVTYKFNDFIQAVHRIYRYLQEKTVTIHIIYTESEQEILNTLQRKWKQHNELVEKMTRIVKQYGLSAVDAGSELRRTIGIKRKQAKGIYYTAINNDCVLECSKMESESVDLIHTSIPFSNHYEYTPSYNDFGHNSDDIHFFGQMDFLIPELLRILKPGRVAAIHIKDRILYGNVTGLGMPSVNPFSDMTTAAFTRHGFVFFGRITVVTDVVRENNQTYRLGWSEQCKDGTKMGCGSNEYILLFRKLPTDRSKAYADVPVKKTKTEYSRARWQIDASGFWRSSGNRILSSDELAQYPIADIQSYFRDMSFREIYDYQQHVLLGEQLDEKGKLSSIFATLSPASHNSAVWDDVVRTFTLNAKQTQKKKQNHICPLQFDIVDRIINRFTNRDELVLDPFAGIMTVPYRAITLDRRGIGIELNSEYFRDGLFYLKQVEFNATIPTLFDIEKIPTN